MSIKNFSQIIFLVLAVFLSVIIISAQPTKQRSVSNKPAVGTPTPQPQSPVTPPTPKKKTIVVLDFNDASLTADAVKRPIGKQIAVLLTTEFARRGNFTVISQRDKEVAVQRVLSKKEGRSKSFEANIGQELSANYVVFGDIVEYTITTKSSNMYVKKEVKYEAKVGFSLTLVDVSTNEVKDGVTVDHVAVSKDSDWGLYGNSNEKSEDLRITMLTEASKVCVAKAADALVRLIAPGSAASPVVTNNSLSTSVPATTGNSLAGSNNSAPAKQEDKGESEKKKSKFPWFGKGDKDDKQKAPSNTPPAAPAVGTGPRIAAIDGASIFVRNLPKDTKVGARIIVFRIGKITKDKQTGEILSQEELPVAELEIVSITEKAFICKIVSGAGITEDDLIKLAK